MLLHRPANRFNLETTQRVQRLRDRTQWVEEEVHWLKYKTQQAQHERLLQLLESKPQRPMALQLPYRDVPYSRNTQFHFREQLLASLATHLDPGGVSTTLRTVSLFGLGGVGKTHLALEYAYQHTDNYDAIFWAKAETYAKVRDSICSYGRAMQEHIQSGPQEDAVLIQAFQRWLMTATVQGLVTSRSWSFQARRTA